MEAFKTIGEIVEQAKLSGPVPAAVAAPYDEVTITAVGDGVSAGLIVPELFGDQNLINPLLEKQGLTGITVSHCTDSPGQQAIDSIREKKNRLLIKGSIPTPALLKLLLDKTTGLNSGKVCSFSAVCEIPDFGRLLIISDGGLNVLPSLEQKIDILKNAVELARALRIENPKAAILASMEEVMPNIPASMDAAIITQMARRGQIKGVIVDGPLALDNIVSREAAGKKKIDSPVAGQADIIIVPNIETGNALGKSLGYFAGSINAGIVLGAKVPVVLPSRAGTAVMKWAAIALGVLLSAGE
jgi:phosphotransacetylase